MSILKKRTALGPVRRAYAFLNQETAETWALQEKLAKQEQENGTLRAILTRRAGGDWDYRIWPENVVRVFGSRRTGSSWLTFMMGSLPGHTRWHKPLVGCLFGHLYYERAWPRQDKKHFIMANDYDDTWLASIRSLALDGGTASFPQRAENGYLVIKEPHGSIGAPLFMKAVPESRMVFLVRDPRDMAVRVFSDCRYES